MFLATSAQAPILVRWQYGLGRTVLFASDVKNRWAAEWLRWDGYGKFWAQLVRDTMRRDTAEQVVFRVVREGNEAQVSLRLMTERGAWRNALSPQVRASRPDGGSADAGAAPARPGLLCGEPAGRDRRQPPFTFEVLPAGGVSAQTARRAGTRQLFYPYPDEYRSLPPDLELLETLAAQTGGKVGASIAEIFAAQGDHGVSRTALWPWLAALGLLLYLCDIAVRRAPWFRRWLED